MILIEVKIYISTIQGLGSLHLDTRYELLLKEILMKDRSRKKRAATWFENKWRQNVIVGTGKKHDPEINGKMYYILHIIFRNYFD